MIALVLINILVNQVAMIVAVAGKVIIAIKKIVNTVKERINKCRKTKKEDKS